MSNTKMRLDQLERLLDLFRKEGGVLGRDLPCDRDHPVILFMLENELLQGISYLSITEKGKSWKADQ